MTRTLDLNFVDIVGIKSGAIAPCTKHTKLQFSRLLFYPQVRVTLIFMMTRTLYLNFIDILGNKSGAICPWTKH